MGITKDTKSRENIPFRSEKSRASRIFQAGMRQLYSMHGPAKQCILHILDSCFNNNILFEVNHFCELILISVGLRRGMH